MSGTQVTLQGTLFGNNEPGFTFEPWDITTLFQDRAGTIPVTGAGQSVGYRRDKSGRGNHQVAVSDAKRGIYGWMPKTGRRNLLTYTEQFDNAAWVKLTGATAPSAKSVSFSADGFSRITQTISIASATSLTMNVKFSIDDVGKVVRLGLWSSGLDGLTTGNSGNLTIPPSGVVSFTWSSVTSASTIGIVNSSAAASQTLTVAENGGPQLELGSTATAYQRVVSQYDITEAGVPTCYYVQADGVDDAYVTPTITPNTDKVQVFAGVRKLSDSAIGAVMESSANSNSNAGAIWLLSPGSPGVNQYSFRSKGTTAADANASGFSAPITNILTGLGDIAADSAILRVNGAQVAQSAADQGTGNFLAYPAYIYARAGTSLPFNGLDFGHAVRFGPNLDAATIARVEALIARNTPEVDFLFGGVWNDGYAWNDNTNWNDGV